MLSCNNFHPPSSKITSLVSTVKNSSIVQIYSQVDLSLNELYQDTVYRDQNSAVTCALPNFKLLFKISQPLKVCLLLGII